MREVLLPTQGDTHLIRLWFKFFERWENETDYLSVHINNDNHGTALKHMVPHAKGDYLLLIEDDGIIFNPGIVDKCFKKLENDVCDVIGSPRMSCNPELAELAREEWGLNYEGLGDKGPNFWPNFFFVKKDLLLQTDLHFANKGWKAGEIIKLPNHEWQVKSESVAGDTFVWTSLQLRSLGARIHEVPQHHSSPYDLKDYESGEGVFRPQVDWVHIGSLTGNFSRPESELEQLEAEKRVMWFELAGKDMRDVVALYDLDRKRIQKWKEAYKELVKL